MIVTDEKRIASAKRAREREVGELTWNIMRAICELPKGADGLADCDEVFSTIRAQVERAFP